jgi:selenide,water dikinase
LAQVLQPLDDIFPTKDFPALLVGLSSPDDSAVYRVNDEQALISTVDFFPPVVDDPYAFGVIAAANALSDIYAMGGEPILAINLVAFPDTLDKEILTEILRGGAEKVREAGAVIAGGHSVTDKEPKYGMAVTGLVHPARIITKGGAQPGDQLLLTKPLGTGVITTALKNDKAQPEHVESAIVSMSRLNRTASRLAQKYSAHAMTDITGYSLLGHGHEMAHLSEVDFRIAYSTLHWLPGAEDYGAQGIFPGGMWRNREYFEQWVEFEVDLTENQQNLLFDPQTSGGLLIAVAPEKAQPLQDELKSEGVQVCIIGEVQHGIGKIHVVL